MAEKSQGKNGLGSDRNNSRTASGNDKNNFWQIVRGICILAVVMIHCPDASSYSVGSFVFTTWVVIRQFINFPVALFIFMAAYFTNVDKCESDMRTYVLGRGGYRLLLPFVIWSLFYSLVSIAGNIVGGENINWLWYLYRFVIGKASTPFYYIVVLIQLTILTPWLIWVIKRNGWLSKLLWFVTPVYMILIYYWNFTGSVPELFGTVFSAWFIFYYLGLNVKINKKKWIRISEQSGRWYLPLIMVAVSIAEAFLLLRLGCGSSFITSQVKLSSFLYVLTLIMLLLKMNRRKQVRARGVERILILIGDYSYGIFFIHCFILRFVTKALRIVGIDSFWILYFLLTWVILSAVSFAVVMVVNKALGGSTGGKKILGWIGFK